MSMLYLNGSIVAESEARISVQDRGFLYGHSVFETMAVHNYQVFRLEAHLERLVRSAQRALIALPALDALRAAVRATVRANLFGEGGLRLTVSGGIGGAGLAPAEGGESTVVVSVRPPRDLAAARVAGVGVVICDTRRGMPDALPLDAKTGSMLTQVIASQAAREAGAFEAILLDDRGLVAEGSMSNLFVARGGVVRTPRVDGRVLPGITRAAVLDIARELGIDAEEGTVEPDELSGADEIWLTNSLIEMVPVRSMAGRSIAPPWPLFGRVHEAYRALVQAECVRPPEESRRATAQ